MTIMQEGAWCVLRTERRPALGLEHTGQGEMLSEVHLVRPGHIVKGFVGQCRKLGFKSSVVSLGALSVPSCRSL